MTESKSVAREYGRLTTNMNLALVDENLYMSSLRNRKIPYDIRTSTFDSQNSKTKKPGIPPICSSLTRNCKLATPDVSAQPSDDRNELLSLDQTFRQRSPPTPLIGPEQISWTSDQVNVDRTSEKFSLTLGQDYGDTRLKTVFTPQHPIFMSDELVYSKLYHPVTNDESGINRKFDKDINLSEHVSERLKTTAVLERRPNDGREGSHSGSSDYTASALSLIENRYQNQIHQVDKFIHKR